MLIFILAFSFLSFDNLYYLGFVIAYILTYFLLPISIILLVIIIIINLKKTGFINGIKESSIQVFISLFVVLVCYGTYKFKEYRTNKINVQFTNRTNQPITDIVLAGRNASTTIDKLNPKQSRIEIFRGKDINNFTKNDHENEVKLYYVFNNKLNEVDILSGFNRWLVIEDDWQIDIIVNDSINIDIHRKINK